jgi:predicted acetyltransferase
MNLALVIPSIQLESEWHNVIREFELAEEKIVPYSLKLNLSDYQAYLNRTQELSLGINLDGRVQSDTYFLVNTDINRILGAINLRYTLNDYLAKIGGHIGYGIRPSERQKGYAKTMLLNGLAICRNHGLKKVLITCDKLNIASAKTMMSCGAILENEVTENDEIIQRYWIHL